MPCLSSHLRVSTSTACRSSLLQAAARPPAPAFIAARQCRRAPPLSRPHLSLRAAAGGAGESGAAALPGLAETAALDELIDLLLTATDANDLTQKVAENMMSFDQRFWLRLATRTDSAAEEEEKERLAGLAKVVMQLLDAMIKRTNEQLNDSATVLQEILKAAADERTGEWKVPLAEEKITAMRAALEARADHVDEALLSNCFAWIRKSSDDNLDGMVTILQKVLQLYASRALSLGDGSAASPADSLVAELIAEDEGKWAGVIRRRAQAGEISELSFFEALQRRMEAVVLGLSSGSYAQRVQAEYLKEMEERAKGVFADLAAGR